MGRSVFFVLVIIGILFHVVHGQVPRPRRPPLPHRPPRPGLRNVTGCPNDCKCFGRVGGSHFMGFMPMRGFHIDNMVTIRDCRSDPLTGLGNIFSNDSTIDNVVIVNSLGGANGAGASYMGRVVEEFRKLRYLRVLRIPYNNVTVLPEELGYMWRLTRLDVSNNKLRALPHGISSMSSLVELDVSNNDLTTLSMTGWRLSSLTRLDISHNRIMAVDMRQILAAPYIRADLSHNQISTLGSVPMGEPSFVSINLSNNKLTSLDAWYFRLAAPFPPRSWQRDYGRSRYLYVSNNLVSNVTNARGLVGLPSYDNLPNSRRIFWKVILTYNQMRYASTISNSLKIPDGKMVHTLYTEGVDLKNNPLACDCVDYSVYQWLGRLAIPPAITCGSPRHLKGHLVVYVDKDQFACNITKGCPPGCHCNKSPHNKTVNTYCLEPNANHQLPIKLPALPDSDYTYKLNVENGLLTNLTYQPYLANTVSVSFRNNQISYIEPNFFNTSNFISVDLRDNRLTSVDSWPLRMVIEQEDAQIYFNGNPITSVTNEVGYNPREPYKRFHHKELYDIFMSFNNTNITHFHPFMAPWNLTKKILFDLIRCQVLTAADSPINCDCSDYELYQRIRYDTNITCAEPAKLRGQDINRVKPDDLVCVTQKGCPKGCRCTDITNQALMTVDCRNWTGTQLPMSLPGPRIFNPDLGIAFHYNVDFDGCNLTVLSNRSYLPVVRNGSFSHNNIHTIERGFFWVWKRYDVVKLDDNQLDSIPNFIVNRPYMAFYLSGNQFNCTCEHYFSLNWIHTNKNLMADYDRIHCSAPEKYKGKDFGEVVKLFNCAGHRTTTGIHTIYTYVTHFGATNIIMTTLAIVLFLILVIFCWRKHKTFRAMYMLVRNKRHPNKLFWPYGGDLSIEFDLFVSYVKEDAQYIEGFLVPRLEEMGFKICKYRLKFHKADVAIWEANRAMMKSEKTLVFASKAYLKDPDGVKEFYSALTLHIKDGNRLVTIKDTDVNIRDADITLLTYFKHYQFIKLESPKFWDDLLHKLQIERIDGPDNGNDDITIDRYDAEMAILDRDG